MYLPFTLHKRRGGAGSGSETVIRVRDRKIAKKKDEQLGAGDTMTTSQRHRTVDVTTGDVLSASDAPSEA
jgi:hypothetical protein